MIRSLTLALSSILVLAFSGMPARAAQPTRAVETCKARSGAMLDALVKKDYTKVRAHFDATMRKQFDVATIRSFWTRLTRQDGDYTTRGEADVHADKGYIMVSTPLTFAKGPVHATVACDHKGDIAGLRFVPVDSAR